MLPSKSRSSRTRTRSSSHELGTFVPPKFLFTPADKPPAYIPPPAKFAAKKSNSSPLLYSEHSAAHYAPHRRMSAQIHCESDQDDRDDDEDAIYTARPGSSGNIKALGSGLRARIFGIGTSSRSRDRPKTICTTPGEVCAGETETEIDEPVSSAMLPPTLDSRSPVFPAETPAYVTHNCIFWAAGSSN